MLLCRLVDLVEDAAVTEEPGLRHAPAAELLDAADCDMYRIKLRNRNNRQQPFPASTDGIAAPPVASGTAMPLTT